MAELNEPGQPESGWENLAPPDTSVLGDYRVDLADIARLTRNWLRLDCEKPTWCEQTDINRSRTVDMNDLEAFTANWLSGIPQ